MKTVRVKNNTNADRTFYTQLLTPDEYHTIPSDKLETWANDIDFQKDILDGYALINDGSTDFDAYGEGLNYLKGVDDRYNSEGALMVEVEPKIGSRKTITTHNFCDPCTWYELSTRNSGVDGYGEILTSSDGYATYESPDGYVNWIDLTHGRQTAENILSGYELEVTVDGYSKVEDLDYTINYEDGYVLFDPALTSSNEVRATYNFATGSQFTLGPSAGKKLRILYTEVQFGISATLNYKNPIIFQVWVGNPYYGVEGHPYEFMPKLPYGDPEMYKSERDLINISNGGGQVKKFGSMVEDVTILPFKYAAVTDLLSSQGAEIRMSIQNDIAPDGYYGTMTAYCLSEDE